MPRTNQAMTAPTPSSNELNAKALTVLRAARNVFLTHGFSAATTDMIQREAGVSKSTVYAHYANKEALFTAVIEAECASFTKTVHGIEFVNDAHSASITAVRSEEHTSELQSLMCTSYDVFCL